MSFFYVFLVFGLYRPNDNRLIWWVKSGVSYVCIFDSLRWCHYFMYVWPIFPFREISLIRSTTSNIINTTVVISKCLILNFSYLFLVYKIFIFFFQKYLLFLWLFWCEVILYIYRLFGMKWIFLYKMWFLLQFTIYSTVQFLNTFLFFKIKIKVSFSEVNNCSTW